MSICFEVLSASVGSIKLLLGGCLAWQGVGHGVCISGHIPGGSDLRCWQPYAVCVKRLSPVVHTSRVLSLPLHNR